jgi:hypothetical protein
MIGNQGSAAVDWHPAIGNRVAAWRGTPLMIEEEDRNDE